MKIIKPKAFEGKLETVTPQQAAQVAERLATFADAEGITPAQLMMGCDHLAKILAVSMRITERRK